MMTTLVIVLLLILFGAVVFRGAPYVPTHRRTVEDALDLLNLEQGDLIVDLGSGDGAVLKHAARRGYRAIGYEINPILCAVAYLRCFGERPLVSVRLRDFWISSLPPDTKAVFVFLAGPYMRRFKRKLDDEMRRRNEPLLVVSNGFAIPGVLPKKISKGLYVYELKP